MTSESDVRFPSPTYEFRVRHAISESYKRIPSPMCDFRVLQTNSESDVRFPSPNLNILYYTCVYVSCPDHAYRNAGVKQWFGDEINTCMYCCIVGCVFLFGSFFLFHFSTKRRYYRRGFFPWSCWPHVLNHVTPVLFGSSHCLSFCKLFSAVIGSDCNNATCPASFNSNFQLNCVQSLCAWGL